MSVPQKELEVSSEERRGGKGMVAGEVLGHRKMCVCLLPSQVQVDCFAGKREYREGMRSEAWHALPGRSQAPPRTCGREQERGREGPPEVAQQEGKVSEAHGLPSHEIYTDERVAANSHQAGRGKVGAGKGAR